MQRSLPTRQLHSFGKWIALASVVGVLAGLGAIAFDLLGQAVAYFTLAQYAGYTPSEAIGEHKRFISPDTVFSPWMIVVVMTIGGLVSGIIVHTLAPEAEGAGTDAAIDAFHNHRGKIRGRIPFVKTIASAITMGTGGSGGREGPIAQIGAGIGSWIGERLRLSHRERRILLAAGMGAGVGAIFRAPLAGAIFAGEILYSDSDLESDVIVPAASASVIAYSVYIKSLPAESRFLPLFGRELEHMFQSPLELIPYALLAVILTLGAVFYITVSDGTRNLFSKSRIFPHLRPAVGAAIAGLIAIGLLKVAGGNRELLGVLGSGYGTLQIAVTSASSLGVGVLLAIAIGKVFTTALTISSGGSGGVFGPSMVIGGCLGGAVGLALHTVWPSVVREPEAFAVVGMAGFFAGVARAPISTILMVRALTGDYGLLIPTMLVSTLTFVTCYGVRLYKNQVPNRTDSKAHRGDFIIDVLEGLKVKDIFVRDRELMMVPEGMTMESIVHSLAYNHQHYFPVIDENGKMVGIFSDEDVRSYLYDDSIWKLANAEDIMTTKFVSVSPNDNLNTALKRFTALNLDELPIIDPDEPGVLIGMLRRKETIGAYNQRLMELKKTRDDHDPRA